MNLLSVRDAAQRLGISTATLYGLCAARKIRHERHGLGRGRIKIPEDAIEEYRQLVTVDISVRQNTPPRQQRLAAKPKHLSL